uniref:Rad21/Rec8-like protein N-terminal domain-containing protein n=1 Tax=Oryza punctata TaxID=4537 RepID=A0A0E0L651_ORYPU
MFYSHLLLARKTPLGQIWMAATLHSKINRKGLDKLDIIKICEEILNPSVPMALRLSGILMGGVAIVYQRKVAIEINEAWRVKPVADPTVLPKGKTQAKYEAVTLPENMMDTDVEQPMLFSEADTTRFRGMRLEDLDEKYFNVNLDDDDFSQAENHHQENITLADNFGSGLGETDVFNRFERFQVIWFLRHLGRKTLFSNKKSIMLPHPLFMKKLNKVNSSTWFNLFGPKFGKGGSSVKDEQEQQKMKGQQPAKSSKRKKRREDDEVMMDNDQIMIPGNVYQTWLKDPSSLITKRRRINSKVNLIRSIKIRDLMDLPLVSLIYSLEKSPLEFYYPKKLMQLWKECTEVKSPKAPSSGGQQSSSPEQQQRNSPPQAFPTQPQVDNDREMGFHPVDFADDIEKLRGNTSVEYERDYDAFHSDHSVTPGSPGLSRRSASSSGGSGRVFTPLDPEVQLPSGRSKRRQHSSGKSFGNLDPVEEELPLEQELRGFKMRRLSDVGPTPDLLEETEPTQTPYEKKSNPIDQVTQSIHSYLKLHFDTPGASQSESLSQLAYGMTTAKAARLFYQACVLATHDFIKVNQLEPYGDILISRGPKIV